MFQISLIFAMVLSCALVAVFFFTSYSSPQDSGEKLTPFECGFEPLSTTRTPFSTRFFILVVLFLVFDVEVALLFPILTMLESSPSILVGVSVLLFLLILLVGLFHEWNEGALDWMSSF